MAIAITQKTATANTTKSAGRSILYIVVHYTAGTSSAGGAAQNVAAYFAKTTTKASADFIVDDEEIVQYNPDIANRYCWHCGGSKLSTQGGSLYKTATNKNSIGVEICSTNSMGQVKDANDSTWSFTDAVLERAAEFIRYLMETYNIDADHVIRHYDVNGKLCPGVVGWNADSGDESKWEAFKALLTDGSSSATETAASTAETSSTSSTDTAGSTDGCPFLVKMTTAHLNIRTGPGTNYSKTGKYTGVGTFTVTKVSEGTGSDSGWGYLKSGAGWISLDYTVRV